MTELTIDAQRRDETGTRHSQNLRDQDIVPGVLYDAEAHSHPIQLKRQELIKALHGETHLFQLSFSEDTVHAVIKEVQWDSLGEKILHVDFKKVTPDEEVEVKIPVERTGTSMVLEGTGAYLEQHRYVLSVQCKASEIPERISVDISGIEIGDTIHVSDLDIPEGVSSAIPETRLMFSVHEAEELEEEDEEEIEIAPTAVEPELVGEEEEEEEAAAEEAEGETEEEA